MPSSRFYIAVLVAVVAAFFVVPVAQAAANTVKVTVAGTGEGKVQNVAAISSVTPKEIDCPGVCEGSFSTESVALISFAKAGSEFTGWTITKGSVAEPPLCEGGELEKEYAKEFGNEFFGKPGDGMCMVEPSAGVAAVTATFTAVPSGPKLTIAKTGEGTVTSNPKGIECTGAKTGAECEASFKEGETVELTASPAAGYAFSAWGGCLTHEGLKCTVLMDKAKTVKVTFVATPSLTVEKAGSGYGKVAATGISCDESCSKESSAVKTGTSVTVKTTPAKGNEAAVIEGGTGSASACSGSTCTFTIGANSSLKVKFSPIPSKTLTVKLTGPGAYKGKVSGKGTTVKGLVSTAILCGTGCTTETESFFATGTTELVASTVTGYKFAGWTVTGGTAGSCTGTTSPCSLATDANKTVEAEFK